jgi:hypothetical protein
MNSAPAELLHPLTYAALQPTGDTLLLKNYERSPKKTPAITPASEFCLEKNKPFFKEKAASPD